MANWLCFEFHHDGEEKKYSISTLAQKGYAIETIKAEIAKCVVLCANCHRIRHAGNVWLEDSNARSPL
jgi:predicted HNH restriction endonuclease